LSKLCKTLAHSMIGGQPVSLKVVGDGEMVSSNDAVSIDHMVTEGVINALKHAFPEAGGLRCRRRWLEVVDRG
jgi:two-component sensor histidine kinase